MARRKVGVTFVHIVTLACGRWKALAVDRKIHLRQEMLAGRRKHQLCVGPILAILTSYPPPDKVAQVSEPRRIEELMSKFAAFTAELLRIPSDKIGVHQCVDLIGNVHST
jgi:hypothetical protein